MIASQSSSAQLTTSPKTISTFDAAPTCGITAAPPATTSSVNIGRLATLPGTSYSKLLIDHARIGHTFFRPENAEMERDLAESCNQHDQMVEAIANRDESAMVSLIGRHWGLCRSNMEMFVVPRELPSSVMKQASSG